MHKCNVLRLNKTFGKMHYIAYIILKTGRENARHVSTHTHTHIHRIRTDARNIDRYSDNYIMLSSVPWFFHCTRLHFFLLLLVVVAVVSSYSQPKTNYSPVGVCLKRLCVNTRQLAVATLAFNIEKSFFDEQPADNEQAKINFFFSHTFSLCCRQSRVQIIPISKMFASFSSVCSYSYPSFSHSKFATILFC